MENTARVRERTGLDAGTTALSAARLARPLSKAHLGRPGSGARKPISPGRTPVPGRTGGSVRRGQAGRCPAPTLSPGQDAMRSPFPVTAHQSPNYGASLSSEQRDTDDRTRQRLPDTEKEKRQRRLNADPGWVGLWGEKWEKRTLVLTKVSCLGI